MKITERHLHLLDAVAAATRPSEDGERSTYFVPNRKGNWSPLARERLCVWGSGDAARLRKLESEGLILNAMSPINPYCYRVTQIGREYLAIAAAPASGKDGKQ